MVMKWMKSLLIVPTMLTLIAASPASNTSPDEMLKSSGFQTRRAENDAQRRQVKALPDGKMCAVNQNGKRYYVYADKRHNQIYVGNEEKHKRFRSSLKQGANGNAISRSMYDNRGNAVQVNEFSGFGPFPD